MHVSSNYYYVMGTVRWNLSDRLEDYRKASQARSCERIPNWGLEREWELAGQREWRKESPARPRNGEKPVWRKERTKEKVAKGVDSVWTQRPGGRPWTCRSGQVLVRSLKLVQKAMRRHWKILSRGTGSDLCGHWWERDKARDQLGQSKEDSLEVM